MHSLMDAKHTHSTLLSKIGYVSKVVAYIVVRNLGYLPLFQLSSSIRSKFIQLETAYPKVLPPAILKVNGQGLA